MIPIIFPIQRVFDQLKQIKIIQENCVSKKICSIHYEDNEVVERSYGKVLKNKNAMPTLKLHKLTMSTNDEASSSAAAVLNQVCIFILI